MVTAEPLPVGESAVDAGLIVEHAACTVTGPVRERNEDHVGWTMLGGAHAGPVVLGGLAPDESGAGSDAGSPPDGAGWAVPVQANVPAGSAVLLAVADGLGAYGGGDVASWLALNELLGMAAAASGTGPSAGLLRTGFGRANQRVVDAALAGQGTRAMQTTLTALLLGPGEAYLGHVGDCRAYRLRDGELELLTTDHTQVMELLRLRLVSPGQAAEHPARYALTRALGGELTVRTDVRQEPLRDGDAFLLCSDGLWSKVDAGEIGSALRGDVDAACDRLVRAAVERGGEDNASALAVRVRRAGRAAQVRDWRRLFRR